MGGQLSSATESVDDDDELPSSSTMKKQEKEARDKGGASTTKKTTTTTTSTGSATATASVSSKPTKTASTTTKTAPHPPTTTTTTTTTAAAVTTTTTPQSSAPTTPIMGMKQSKSDHSGLAGRGGKSSAGTSSSTTTTDNKKYMSKSQDNLSSGNTSKKKLTTVKEVEPSRSAQPASGTTRPPSAANPSGSKAAGGRSAGKTSHPATTAQAGVTATTTTTATVTATPSKANSLQEKNKENQVLKEKEKNSMFVKPKPVKGAGGGGGGSSSSMRKASSTQSIDMGSNTTGSLRSLSSNKSSASHNSMKRAQSTQNVSKDKLLKKRTSAPADVMAYNAELLANFEKEKKVLEERISQLTKLTESRKAEIEKHKYEVKHLKETVAANQNNSLKEELDELRQQNRYLTDRLQQVGVAVEQFTDNEKLIMKIGGPGSVRSLGKSGDSVSASDCLLHASLSCDSLSTDGAKAALPPGVMDTRVNVSKLGPMQRSSSLSASEPGLSLTDLCVTTDHPSMDHSQWDKASNKSCNSDALSEISVACLTERILQMEETNYSTTEELQATLQELGDLQDAVNELTEENGRLTDEKTVLLESLCTQTEKLETTRTQVEQLKSLLITGKLLGKTDRETQLLELLKSAQEEREELFRKQTEWSNALRSMEADRKEYQDLAEMLRDKAQALEDRVQAVKSERDAQERLVAELRENVSADQIELDRLNMLMDSEKSKVAELEKCQQAENQTELEALLDQTRQEKARGEQRLASLQESLALSQNEVARIRESLATRDEELKVLRNNARTEVCDLQYRMEKIDKERSDAVQELETLREHIDQLQQDCDTYLEEKKTYCSKVQEVTGELHGLRTQKSKAESDLNDLMSRHESEAEEWQQFQKDLQVAVVIANDFRAETQEGMQKVSEENVALREKSLNLQLELDRVKSELQAMRSARSFEESRSGPTPRTILSNAELKGKVAGCVDRDLVASRDGRRLDPRAASQSLSVKALIRSIEDQRRSNCSSIHSSHGGSRRNSTDTESSFTSYQEFLKSPTSPPTPSSPSSPTKEFRGSLSSMEKSGGDGKLSLQNRLSGSGLAPVVEAPSGSSKAARPGEGEAASSSSKVAPQISSILKERGNSRRNSAICDIERKDSMGKDPLSSLAKQMGGSKRNALLKWCQQKTLSYKGVDITNFSSSWNDGLAFSALMHGYLPEKIPYNSLTSEDKRRNFTLAFTAAESVGISSSLNLNDMVAMERPDWQAVMTYVTSIYKHFEVDIKQQPSGSSPSPS
ncbi:hypothetical protein ACOMHN_065944 [Nucella lapillus]